MRRAIQKANANMQSTMTRSAQAVQAQAQNSAVRCDSLCIIRDCSLGGLLLLRYRQAQASDSGTIRASIKELRREDEKVSVNLQNKLQVCAFGHAFIVPC